MGQSGQDLTLTTHSQLTTRLKKEYNYNSNPSLVLHALLWNKILPLIFGTVNIFPLDVGGKIIKGTLHFYSLHYDEIVTVWPTNSHTKLELQ
jgi:hypothetical protein